MPIKHTLIIAGMSRAGKSFLIERLRSGTLPKLQKILGVRNLQNWGFLQQAWYLGEKQSLSERLLVHYDIYAVAADPGITFGELDFLLSNSERTTIVTIMESTSVLIQRNRAQTIKHLLSYCKLNTLIHPHGFFRPFRYFLAKGKAYNRGIHQGYHQEWFSFLKQYPRASIFTIMGSRIDDASRRQMPTGEMGIIIEGEQVL